MIKIQWEEKFCYRQEAYKNLKESFHTLLAKVRSYELKEGEKWGRTVRVFDMGGI